MVVRMRATKGHRNNRRAHHALTSPALSACPDCKAPKRMHAACPQCGKYKGRVAVHAIIKQVASSATRRRGGKK